MEANIKAQFEKDGYYVAKGVFSPEEVVLLEKDFDKIVDQMKASNEMIDGTWSGTSINEIKGKDDIIIHTHNVHQYSRNWLNAFLHEKFLGVAKAILGEDIVMHHSKLFQKPKGKGSPFPMHQDWSYFPTINDSMMAAIIHVSNATDEMGCLRVYPESHKLGRVEFTDGTKEEGRDFLSKYPIEKATVLEAEPGDVVFFHYFTLHGSMPNHSDKTRKTVLIQMYEGHDKMEDGIDHPDERLTISGWNYQASRDRAGVTK